MHTRDFKLFALVLALQCALWLSFYDIGLLFIRFRPEWWVVSWPVWVAQMIVVFLWLAPLVGYFVVIYRLSVCKRFSAVPRVVFVIFLSGFSALLSTVVIMRLLTDLGLITSNK
jgi:hypothetical protein